MDFMRIEFINKLKRLYSIYPIPRKTYEIKSFEFGRRISEFHILQFKTSNMWPELHINHYYYRPVNEKHVVEYFNLFGSKADPVFRNETDTIIRRYHKQHIYYKNFSQDILDELYNKIDLMILELI